MMISIHALLAESDTALHDILKLLTNFYPRSPCGERLVYALKLTDLVLFLSTLSLRRATSIGTLRTVNVRNFYPRSPCGERRRNSQNINRGHRFLSTLSLRRATLAPEENPTQKRISIHALLAESDARRPGQNCQRIDFYPRSPCGERPASVA